MPISLLTWQELSSVPEIIDPVFAKTSQNARFLLSENERFGLVFVKTGSINSGTDQLSDCQFIKSADGQCCQTIASDWRAHPSCLPNSENPSLVSWLAALVPIYLPTWWDPYLFSLFRGLIVVPISLLT